MEINALTYTFKQLSMAQGKGSPNPCKWSFFSQHKDYIYFFYHYIRSENKLQVANACHLMNIEQHIHPL